ncbi:hypothetical protein [Salarchaeum japonicum]|uniref:hypothetical protein n=1 Tax=Salarchaeum japonicum TaxID=555573 RepID=UPI003C776990
MGIGSMYVFLISLQMNPRSRATVIATLLGAIGTFLLAVVTVYNITQTNRTLRLREKEAEKPLIIDEISNILEPSITQLEQNLDAFENTEGEGCAFNWIHATPSPQYGGANGPGSIELTDPIGLARIQQDNQKLYKDLERHELFLRELSEDGDQFYEQIRPKIQELLKEADIETGDESNIAIAVLKREGFAPDHRLEPFWKEYSEELIQFAENQVSPCLTDIKQKECAYQEHSRNLLRECRSRKAHLKQKYKISDNEVEDGESDILRASM